MEKHVLLKKLRDALESLKGRVAGRNKDEVEEAISMVSCISCFISEFLLVTSINVSSFGEYVLLTVNGKPN